MVKRPFLERIERWMFPLVLLLGFFLRIWEFARRDFWYDEAYTAIIVRDSVHGMLTQLAQDVHPPLYFFTVKAFIGLLGQSVASMRFVSVFFGTLGILAVYLFTKELFHRRAALVASFLCALSPFLIGYSQEARMYAMYGFWVVLAGFFFLRSLRLDRWRDGLFWGVCLGAAWLTHYMSFLFLPVFYLVHLVWNVRFEPLKKKRWKDRLMFLRPFVPSPKLLVGLLVAILLFVPWYSHFRQQFASKEEKTKWIPAAVLADVPHDLYLYLVGSPPGELSTGVPQPNALPRIHVNSMVMGLTILLTLMGWMVFTQERKDRRKWIIAFGTGIVFMGGVYILSLLDRRYFISRYMLPAAYFLFVFLGSWLARLSWKGTGTALACYLLLLFALQPTHPSEGYNTFIRHVSEYQGYHFYSLNSFDYVIAKAYLGEERLRLYNVGWPQYDSRPWPGIGYGTQRLEDFEMVKHDAQGLVIWNAEFPVERRDDRRFEELKKDFDLIATYKTLEIYKPKTQE